MVRQLHSWKATIINTETGAQKEIEVHNYWDPDREGVPERVAVAAAAEATVATKQKWVHSGNATLMVADNSEETVLA